MSALVPMYGFLEGDSLGLLVLAHDDWTVAELAERLIESAAVRVRFAGEYLVTRGGRPLDQDVTVTEAGLGALDRFDVVRAGPDT